MQNINNQEALAKLIYNSYAIPQRMNCAGFIYEQTKLFRDEWEKPFKPYFKQIEFMNGLKKEDRVVVILKPRQSGFSTAIVGRVVYESYFNLVPEICIISATRDQANKVLDRIKKAFKSMHESIQPKFTKDNEGLLELANGVKIYSLSSNPDSVRGYTGNVYLDEFAMISAKDSNEIYSAVYPTITKGGRLVIVSTPKGKRGKFYELITKSLQDINGKNVVKANKVIYKLDWRDVPHIKFAVEEMGLFDGMTPDEILQEYELTFSNDDENPFLTVDFILEKLIEKDRIIPTFSSYSDLLIPKEYFDDITTQNPKPLEKAYYIRNNPELKHLFEEYHRFFATHDPASVNDDSVFKVFGQRENGSWDIVFKADLKKIDSDLIVQSKYLKRIFDCFQCEKICIDYTGLGRAVGDFLNNLDDMNLNENLFFFESERNIKVDLYTSLKNMISEGRLKRSFDGSKSDQDEINQYSHVYYRDGKMYKKSGTKDDHADGDMLLCYLIEDDFVDGGIILI